MTETPQNKNPAIQNVVRTSVPTRTRELLFVQSGGRCEFDGCNAFLFEHHVTRGEGNFANVAHIVAFRPRGPRGEDGPRPVDVNEVSNLMLLCPTCHKLVDDDAKTFTRELLEDHKQAHEERIRMLTSLGPDRSTFVVTLLSQIGGQATAIPFAEICAATSPRYPTHRAPFAIDLPTTSDRDDGFWATGASLVGRKVAELLSRFEAEDADHISVFPLAPMPILMAFGAAVGNKIPMELFQHHRESDRWVWPEEDLTADYSFEKTRSGDGRVALVLSLSGQVPLDGLPDEYDSATVYEIKLASDEPGFSFLRSRADLQQFVRTYIRALGAICGEHGLPEEIALFPAVPAPIAVACGRELMPKVHPGLRVFDQDRQRGGFTHALTINPNQES